MVEIDHLLRVSDALGVGLGGEGRCVCVTARGRGGEGYLKTEQTHNFTECPLYGSWERGHDRE